jgi:hypothetical protein
VSAYQWLSLAAQGGNQDAATLLASVSSKMSPQQISDAKAAIANWTLSHPGN